LADRGTLFLDEVGELPLPLQAQLLRAVQERTFKRVGSNTWSQVSFRLVCATNRDLEADMDQGGFRRDFFHRIASRVVHVPPLRDRLEDIVPLAEHFLREFLPPGEAPTLDPAVHDYLRQRPYRGNIRELRQLTACIADRYVGCQGLVTPGDIPTDELYALDVRSDWRDRAFEIAIERAVALGGGLKDIGKAATDTALRIALQSENGNVQRAAKRLGVTDRALQLRRAQAQDPDPEAEPSVR
jgi:transcriptional regulator with GAF, ATPase, and Fis domain